MTERNRTTIGVIDIFAGPGGLGEGFASFIPVGTKSPAFEIGVSAEMEPSAHATLRFRAFLRKLRAAEGPTPWAYDSFVLDWIADPRITPEDRFKHGHYAEFWQEADREALNLKLGIPDHDLQLYDRVEEIRRRHDRLIVVGGPPCQAYSLVGRARNAKSASFRIHGDQRHFLYREYLGILARFQPDVFIMENVKGLLTSKVGGGNMLRSILADLSDPSAAGGFQPRGSRYVIIPVAAGDLGIRDPQHAADNPSQFIVRAEDHGIAQARHRVILMGVREDLAIRAMRSPGIQPTPHRATFREALSGLPELRSGLSRTEDSNSAWWRVVEAERKEVIRATRHTQPDIAARASSVTFDAALPRESTRLTQGTTGIGASLSEHSGGIVANHSTRSHMPADLGRYLYCSLYGLARFASPSAAEFPSELAPSHRNWASGHFADRFRVQLPSEPSSTITSHLSKDGHAFIHPDPWQCRSLTVREAARLQSFPDDYVFLGNRTQQYVQVGNAVPPMLARQIAAEVYRLVS